MHDVTGTGDSVVRVTGLGRCFQRKVALTGIDLEVSPGTVHGIVGENGAGKTTLIKHIMGLLRAKEGEVRVFGEDPVRVPELVLARIGYLTEERDMPGWMRVHELMRYTRAFYPKWDPDYAEELRKAFDLDPKAKLKHLSRGELARAGLLAALAHRPDLLVLDEPSSGLDPIVRRDILGAIVRTVADEGRTVLFSSHLLDEVERVADRVTMLHRGRRVLDADLDDLKASHQRVVVHAANGAPPIVEGLLRYEGRGPEYTLFLRGEAETVQAAVSACGAEVLESGVPSLEEIFVARAGAGEG